MSPREKYTIKPESVEPDKDEKFTGLYSASGEKIYTKKPVPEKVAIFDEEKERAWAANQGIPTIGETSVAFDEEKERAWAADQGIPTIGDAPESVSSGAKTFLKGQVEDEIFDKKLQEEIEKKITNEVLNGKTLEEIKNEKGSSVARDAELEADNMRKGLKKDKTFTESVRNKPLETKTEAKTKTEIKEIEIKKVLEETSNNENEKIDQEVKDKLSEPEKIETVASKKYIDIKYLLQAAEMTNAEISKNSKRDPYYIAIAASQNKKEKHIRILARVLMERDNKGEIKPEEVKKAKKVSFLVEDQKKELNSENKPTSFWNNVGKNAKSWFKKYF